ncbi:MAG: SBBP repeat-containing protein [Bacteroidia bacterium]|nr:SBBP repeat-containing protein [Bacteroidia bacterium]
MKINSFFLTILLPVFILATLNTSAQAPGWQWAKKIGGSVTEIGHGVATDPSGNVIVTGCFTSPSLTVGTTTLTNSGVNTEELFVIKYDANGNVLWAKSAGGSAIEDARSVATDLNGNIYVTGIFGSASITFGSVTLNNTNATSYDMFLVKYDAAGNVLWAKQAGGNSYDLGYFVCTDVSGNAIVAGYFSSSSMTIGTNTLTCPSPSENMFVAKYDANGNVLWAKAAGGAFDEYAHSVSCDPNGNIFVTGFFASATITFGTTTLTNASTGSYDIFIVKYDPNGNEVWAQSAGGTSVDGAESVSADANGNVFITGYFASPGIVFGATTLTNSGASGDLFIVKYDSNGTVLWAKSVGGSSADVLGMCVTSDAGGNALVTGTFKSPTVTFGTYTLTNSTVWFVNAFVAKYDGAGNNVWAKSINGNYEVNAYGICTSPSGKILVTGYYQISPLVIGSTTLSNSGSNDMYVAMLDATTSGIEDEIALDGFSIYPNPSPGIININAATMREEPLTVQLTNTLGQIVLSTTVSGKQSVLNIEHLPDGVYFVTLKNGKLIKTVKIQKE